MQGCLPYPCPAALQKTAGQGCRLACRSLVVPLTRLPSCAALTFSSRQQALQWAHLVESCFMAALAATRLTARVLDMSVLCPIWGTAVNLLLPAQFCNVCIALVISHHANHAVCLTRPPPHTLHSRSTMLALSHRMVAPPVPRGPVITNGFFGRAPAISAQPCVRRSAR